MISDAGGLDLAELLDWSVKFGFAVVVALYLLVQTTKALNGLTEETRKLRESIERAKDDIEREAKDIKEDVKAIARALPH